MTESIDVVHAASRFLLLAVDAEKLVFDRDYDLQKLREYEWQSLEQITHEKLFRRLKVMSRLYPWPSAPTEQGFVDIRLAEKRRIRFQIDFLTEAGKETATVTKISDES